MKKIAIVVVFVAAFASYAFYSYFSSKSAAVTTPVAVATSTSTVTTPVTTTPTTGSTPVTTTPVTTTPVTTTGQYKDGTYTGRVANAFYGNIQVEAIISDGKITKVTFLQYPNDRGQSVSINENAMPILSSEAITAQSAKVDGVSGASQTSVAFEQSLADALSQAKV